jgi:hypothetical protein
MQAAAHEARSAQKRFGRWLRRREHAHALRARAGQAWRAGLHPAGHLTRRRAPQRETHVAHGLSALQVLWVGAWQVLRRAGEMLVAVPRRVRVEVMSAAERRRHC